MKMVQVTNEAKASPIMTALTRTSADRNIDHGDSSRSPAAADFNTLPLTSAEVAASDGPGIAVDGAATGEAGFCAGAAWLAADGAVAAGALCCADDGVISASITVAKITPRRIRIEMFIREVQE